MTEVLHKELQIQDGPVAAVLFGYSEEVLLHLVLYGKPHHKGWLLASTGNSAVCCQALSKWPVCGL